MTSARPTLLHGVHVGPGPAAPAPPAAFGEGSAARTVLLSYLPQPALLEFRRTSKAARDVASSYKYTLIDAVECGELGSIFPRLRAIRAAFAKWADIRITVLSPSTKRCKYWTTENLNVLHALATYIRISFGDFRWTETHWAQQGWGMGLQCQETSSAVDLQALCALRDIFAEPHATRSGPPVTALLPSLRLTTLTLLRIPEIHLTDVDLLPLAPRLTSLVVQECPGVRDLSAFTALRSLQYSGHSSSQDPVCVDPNRLFPLSLHVLAWSDSMAAAPWTSLSHMSQLRTLDLIGVDGLTDTVFSAVPPGLTTARLASCSGLSTALLPSLSRVTSLSIHDITPFSLDNSRDPNAQEMAQARAHLAAVSSVQSLHVCDGLWRCLPVLPGLKSVELTGSDVQAEGAMEVLEAGMPCLQTHTPALEELAIDYTVQQPEVILKHALALPSLRALTVATCLLPQILGHEGQEDEEGGSPEGSDALEQSATERACTLLFARGVCEQLRALHPASQGRLRVWYAGPRPAALAQLQDGDYWEAEQPEGEVDLEQDCAGRRSGLCWYLLTEERLAEDGRGLPTSEQWERTNYHVRLRWSITPP